MPRQKTINNIPTGKPFKKLTCRLAIKAACLQCCCGSPSEVKNCTIQTCALWHYRLGKTPSIPVNALDLLIFPKDPNSTIFSVRKKDKEDDDPHMRTTEYSMFKDDDE